MLVEGVDIVPPVNRAFAVSEVSIQARNWNGTLDRTRQKVKDLRILRREFIPPMSEIREIGLVTYVRCALIGILPGAGGSMAAFEDIAAAESANNSMFVGAFVPMLMFGIPGDPTTAIVLGILVIDGLQPGPRLLENQADLLAKILASLFISALILSPLTLYLLGPYFVRIVSIPKDALQLHRGRGARRPLRGHLLALPDVPRAELRNAGVIHARQNSSTVSLRLGFILGPYPEQYLRSPLPLSDGSPIIYLSSADGLLFLALTAFETYMILLRQPKRPARIGASGASGRTHDRLANRELRHGCRRRFIEPGPQIAYRSMIT